MKYKVFSHSEQGPREYQQDRFYIDTKRNLFIIADGMGGHDNGDLAADDVINSLSEVQTLNPDTLEAAFFMANEKCFARRDHSGSTGICVWFDTYLHILHAGDSRVYLIYPDGTIKQPTTDHVGFWGGITNAIGFLGHVEEYEFEIPPPNTLIVLATDGAFVGFDQISARLLNKADPAEFIVKNAYQMKSTDNATVIAIKMC